MNGERTTVVYEVTLQIGLTSYSSSHSGRMVPLKKRLAAARDFCRISEIIIIKNIGKESYIKSNVSGRAAILWFGFWKSFPVSYPMFHGNGMKYDWFCDELIIPVKILTDGIQVLAVKFKCSFIIFFIKYFYIKF